MEDQLLCFIIRDILKTDMNDFSQKNLLLGNPIQAFRKLLIISAVQKNLQLNDLQTQRAVWWMGTDGYVNG